MTKQGIEKEYELIFKMPAELNQPFVIDLIMNGGYGDFLHIYEKTNPDSEMYLSKNSQIKLAEEGQRFFGDKKKVTELFEAEKKLSKKITKLTSEVSLVKFENIDDATLGSYLSDFYKLFCDYFKIYSFTEVFYFPLVDKKIRGFVNNNIADKKTINHALSLLLNPSEKTGVIEQRDKILSSLNADKEIVYLCKLVRKVGKEKLPMRSNVNNYFEFLENLLEEVSKRLYLAPSQTKSLFCSELFDLLIGKTKSTDEKMLDIANRRHEIFVAIKQNNKYHFYTDKKAQEIKNSVRKKLPKKITEIPGDVVSTGYARGRVVIMPIGIDKIGKAKLKQKMAIMNKGDILVAPTTGPEMIMACRKAGGIVAEEGGINSHAAIISRELGIPGIVNTKIATQVLRDGDLVEINTDKSIVKILKKYG